MYLLEDTDRTAIVPKFMANYRGTVMLPDYGRYERLCVWYLIVALGSVSLAAYSLFSPADKYAILAFSLFMAGQSFKVFTRKLIEVNLADAARLLTRAPIAVSLESFLSGLALLLIGIRYQFLSGEFDGYVFELLGLLMVSVAILFFSSVVWWTKRP